MKTSFPVAPFLAVLLYFLSFDALAANIYKRYAAPPSVSVCTAEYKSGDSTCTSASVIDTTMCQGSGSMSGWRNIQSSGNGGNTLWYLGCVSGFNNSTCPTGGTRQQTTGDCACPSGQTVVNGACTALQVQDCPNRTDYKNSSGVCVPMTDCNLSVPNVGGNFFDVTTGTCKATTDVLICINKDSTGAGGEYSVSCPSLNECIKPGQICSNNQNEIQFQNDAKAGVIAAAKAKALQAANDAAQAKTEAATAKAAKDSASTASTQQASAAQAAAQAAAANGTSSSSAIQAATAAATAAARAASDAIAASNAAAQKAIADASEAIANARNNSLQSPNSYGGGQSSDLASQGRAAADKAKSASIGAVGGTSVDGTTPSGQSDMNCPDCAKETTLQTTNTKLGEIKNAFTKSETDYPGVPEGVPSYSESNTKLVNALKGHFTLPEIDPIEAECPVFERHIPFIEVDLTIDQFCTLEPLVRPYIEGAAVVMWSIMGLFIVLGA